MKPKSIVFDHGFEKYWHKYLKGLTSHHINREDNLNIDDESQKRVAKINLVLAPGASDASEGTVCVDYDHAHYFTESVGGVVSGEKSDVEYKYYAEQQPGDGFWSVAPGCGDISEGRVWVVKVRQ